MNYVRPWNLMKRKKTGSRQVMHFRLDAQRCMDCSDEEWAKRYAGAQNVTQSPVEELDDGRKRVVIKKGAKTIVKYV